MQNETPTPQKIETGGSVRHVDSAGDERTANNAMRHKYRVLSPEEQELMVHIKDLGAAFVNLLHKAGGTTPPAEGSREDHRFASRNLSMAFTHMEDAVMRAVKHITQ